VVSVCASYLGHLDALEAALDAYWDKFDRALKSRTTRLPRQSPRMGALRSQGLVCDHRFKGQGTTRE
jgi:hypothetical protein